MLTSRRLENRSGSLLRASASLAPRKFRFCLQQLPGMVELCQEACGVFVCRLRHAETFLALAEDELAQRAYRARQLLHEVWAHRTGLCLLGPILEEGANLLAQFVARGATHNAQAHRPLQPAAIVGNTGR